MVFVETHNDYDDQASHKEAVLDAEEAFAIKEDLSALRHEIDVSLLDPLVQKYINIPGFDKDRIVQAFRYLDKAIDRLLANPTFASWGYSKEDLLNRFFPLMIKESSLSSSAKSSTGAIGYFQLMPIAKTAAVAYIQRVLGVHKKYDRADAIDNAVLGIVYYLGVVPAEFANGNKEFVMEHVIHHDDVHKFSCAQYNAGGGVMRGLLKKYMYEKNKTSAITWHDFASWLVQKIPGIGQPELSYDPIYDVTYVNWFGNQSSAVKISTRDLVDYGVYASGAKRYVTQKKVHEMIEYVEKIYGIASRKRSDVSKEQNISSQNAESSSIGGFMEVGENSTGLRVRKYTVQSGGTGSRIIQLFRKQYPTFAHLDVSLVNSNNTKTYPATKYFLAHEVVYILENKGEISIDSMHEPLHEPQSLETGSIEKNIVTVVQQNIRKLHNIFERNKSAITLPSGYFLPPEQIFLKKKKHNYFFERHIGDGGSTLIMHVRDKNNTNIHTIELSESSYEDSIYFRIDGMEVRVRDGVLVKGDKDIFTTVQNIFLGSYTTLLQDG